MQPKFFGDSYDLVKRTLIGLLQPLGRWHVHPMFAAAYPAEFVDAFEQLIGAPLLIRDPIPARPRREAHIALAHQHHNVLFDPDTGLKLRGTGAAPRRYLTVEELIAAAQARPQAITAVFDQSLAFGSARAELEAKVAAIEAAGVAAFAYYSHACFVFASANPLVKKVAIDLLIAAGIPAQRLLRSIA